MDETATRRKKIAPALYGVGWEQVPESEMLTEQRAYITPGQVNQLPQNLHLEAQLTGHLPFVWCKDNAFSRFGQTMGKDYLPKQREKHQFRQGVRNERARHVLQNNVGRRVTSRPMTA